MASSGAKAESRLQHLPFSEGRRGRPQEFAARRNRRSSGHFWRIGPVPRGSAIGFGDRFPAGVRLARIVMVGRWSDGGEMPKTRLRQFRRPERRGRMPVGLEGESSQPTGSQSGVLRGTGDRWGWPWPLPPARSSVGPWEYHQLSLMYSTAITPDWGDWGPGVGSSRSRVVRRRFWGCVSAGQA
jgi:hypothetical protein